MRVWRNVCLSCAGLHSRERQPLQSDWSANGGCAHVSLDEINAERGMFGGEGLLAQEWEHTHQIAHERMKGLMLKDRDIVFDDTNCFRWLRDRYRKLARENGYSAAIVFLDVSLEEIRLRVAGDSATSERRSLKPEVLENHLRSFEKPQADENPIVWKNPTDTAEWFRSI
jgi:predicted kinase